MRLIGHIIWKDLRQDRWALGFWLLLFPLHWALGWRLFDVTGRDLDWVDQLRLVNIALTVIEFAIGYLLALRWVQADAVSGTRMFWVTRPISGGRLFSTKVIGLLLMFGLLPVALWLPWWLSCGLAIHEIGWLAVQALGWQLVMIAPALLIGSLTDDFGRAIMWSLILVVGVLAWATLGQSGLTANSDFAIRSFRGLWLSRILVAAVLLVGGLLAIAGAQYASRNSWQTTVRLAVLGLIIVLVGRLWVLDFSTEVAGWPHAASTELAPGAGESLRFSPSSARFSPYTYVRRGEGGGREEVHSMVVSVDVAGLPEDLGLLGDYRWQSLVWPDEPAVRVPESRRTGLLRIESFFRRTLSLPAVGADPETVAWGTARVAKANADRAAKGLPPFENFWIRPVTEPFVLTSSIPVPSSALGRIRAHPPAYVTRLDARLVRPEITQQFPLETGTRGRGSSRTLRVMSVKDNGVRLVDTMPAYYATGLFFSVRAPLDIRTPSRNELWSVNQVTGDIQSQSRRRLIETAISVGGVAMTWHEVNVSPAKWIRNDRWEIKDPAWMTHTEFVVLQYQLLDQFTRDIRGDRLLVRLPPEPPPLVEPGEGLAVVAGN